MSVAALRIYRQTSLPQRLTAVAVLAYLGVFLIFVGAGRPGLGIGQGFYIPVILVALGSTTAAGVTAGVAAGALYEIGLVLAGGGAASSRVAVHLAGYVLAGALVGYFATRARSMLSEALHLLEDLLAHARRDVGTGLLDREGLDRVLAERTGARTPFTLVLGEFAVAEGDDAALRHAAEALLQEAEPAAEIARIGPAHVAVVTTPRSAAAARALAGSFERASTVAGGRATFGWAVHPAEGTDSWTLFRAASERLYARRIVRGEWTPTAASAGLVDELMRGSSVQAE